MICTHYAEEALLFRLKGFLPGVTVEPTIPLEATEVAVGFRFYAGHPEWQWKEGSNEVWAELVYQVVAVAEGGTLAVVAEADLQIERALKNAEFTLDSGAVIHQIIGESPVRFAVEGEDGVLRQVSGGLYRMKLSPPPIS